MIAGREFLEARKYSPSVRQSCATLEVVRRRLPVGHQSIVHRRDRPALAGHLRGDALHDLAGGAASTSTLNSDWPSRSMKPGAATRFVASMVSAPSPTAGSDRRDGIADNPEVAAEPRRAGAVDDPAVGEEHVECAGSLRRQARTPERAQSTAYQNVAQGFNPAIAARKPALSSPFDKLRTSVEGGCATLRNDRRRLMVLA